MLAPPAGACATASPQTSAFAARIASPRPLELSHCAHAQGQSRVPICRTVLEEYAAPAARGMQTEMPSKQAALARQVRQRMNRLCKPEHRARFCFFSKKKSPAGTRRFPIPSKSRFRWALTAVLSIRAAPKTLLQPPPFAGACATAPAGTTAAERLPCSPTSRRLRHHTPSRHCICRPHRIIAHLGAVLLRACAGPEPGSSMPHGTRRACRARRMGDANGNAAQTGGFGAASAAKDEPARQARALRALLLLF